MRSGTCRFVLSSVLAVAAWTALPAQTPPGSAEETAVRDVVRKYVDARERADAKAVAALFTEESDQLTSSGEWRKGRDAVVKGSLASSQRNAGRRTIDVETVRFVSRDVAIADGRYQIAGEGAAPRRMWTTFVMHRRRNGWRIAAIRNMLAAPGQ